MRKKFIIWLGLSMLIGVFVSLSSLLFSYPDNCIETALTCFRNRGFPIVVSRGLGYEGLPWDFSLIGVFLNTFFWVLFSVIVFIIIFYILDRKRRKK